MGSTAIKRMGWKSPTIQREQILKHLRWHMEKRQRFNLPQNDCEACTMARKLLEGANDGASQP